QPPTRSQQVSLRSRLGGQNVTVRSVVAMSRATSGGVTHRALARRARSASVAPRATAQAFQTWTATPLAVALATNSVSGGTPIPWTVSATPALTSSVASPANTSSAVSPASVVPLTARWKGSEARVGSAGPVA